MVESRVQGCFVALSFFRFRTSKRSALQVLIRPRAIRVTERDRLVIKSGEKRGDL